MQEKETANTLRVQKEKSRAKYRHQKKAPKIGKGAWIPPECRKLRSQEKANKHPTYRRKQAHLNTFTVPELRKAAIAVEHRLIPDSKDGVPVSRPNITHIKKMRKKELVLWMT